MERMKEVYSKMMEVVLALCHCECDVAESYKCTRMDCRVWWIPEGIERE